MVDVFRIQVIMGYPLSPADRGRIERALAHNGEHPAMESWGVLKSTVAIGRNPYRPDEGRTVTTIDVFIIATTSLATVAVVMQSLRDVSPPFADGVADVHVTHLEPDSAEAKQALRRRRLPEVPR